MSSSQRWLLALAALVGSAGFIMQMWPLALAGVLTMGFVGRGWFALPAGLLLDLAYGAPFGMVAYLFFPFTIAGLAVVVVRFWTGRYFFDKTSQDRLD